MRCRRSLSVGFEPQLQMHQKAIERLTVHLCNTVIHRSIWYRNTRRFSMIDNEFVRLGMMIPICVNRLHQC